MKYAAGEAYLNEGQIPVGAQLASARHVFAVPDVPPVAAELEEAVHMDGQAAVQWKGEETKNLWLTSLSERVLSKRHHRRGSQHATWKFGPPSHPFPPQVKVQSCGRHLDNGYEPCSSWP